MEKCGIDCLAEIMKNPENRQIVDVREPAEFESGHIAGTLSLPLSGLNKDSAGILKKNEPVYILCRSGMRACKASELLREFGFSDLYVVEGGFQAWVASGGKAVYGPRKVWGLERQVRFAAGALVLAGVFLSKFAHPYWLWLAAFVGAGLVFSGVTDTCGMALLLARMPWNRKAKE